MGGGEASAGDPLVHGTPVVGDLEVPPMGEVKVERPLVQKIGVLRPQRAAEGGLFEVVDDRPGLIARKPETAEMPQRKADSAFVGSTKRTYEGILDRVNFFAAIVGGFVSTHGVSPRGRNLKAPRAREAKTPRRAQCGGGRPSSAKSGGLLRG